MMVWPADAGKEQLLVTDISSGVRGVHFADIAQGGHADLREAFRAARTTREPVVVKSAVQVEESSADLLMIHAVYVERHNQTALRDMFMGWVAVAFSAQNTFDGVSASLGDKYELTVFQVGSSTVETALFSTSQDAKPAGAFSQFYPAYGVLCNHGVNRTIL